MGDGEGEGCAPWLAWLVEVDDYFFCFETEFVQGDVGAVREGAAVVRVESYLGLDAFVLAAAVCVVCEGCHCCCWSCVSVK